MIEKIKTLEEELRLAMLKSDIDQLENLIADCLIFTLPNGEIVTKEADIHNHRSGLQQLTHLECLNQEIRTFSNFSIVASKMRMEGTFNQNKIDGIYCYTRVWTADMNNNFQVVAGQVTFVNN